MTHTTSARAIHQAWRTASEIALVDVREEDEFARGHPLFAASLPLGRLELDVLDRIPRLSTKVVCYDDGGNRAARAAAILQELGYSDVSLLDGGLAGWRAEGFEEFLDVNSPSKAFGELVADRCTPPFISPEDLDRRVRAGDDLIVVDARRYDEFTTMSIPSAHNVPGGELVYRVGSMLPHASTIIVVNCAGRTRSIIGAQSLRNAGYSQPVMALRNGTIGWTLAGLDLDQGGMDRFETGTSPRPEIAARVHALGEQLGVQRIDAAVLDALRARPERTTYRFDVREPSEFFAGHLVDFLSAPGGQLVQETDAFAPVRGATIVLADDDGVRAGMTGTWLAQMGWAVAVIRIGDGGATSSGAGVQLRPVLPEVPGVAPEELAELIGRSDTRVLDLAASRNYRTGHLPGAEFVLRGALPDCLGDTDRTGVLVLTSEDGAAATFAAAELISQGWSCVVLAGGTDAWRSAEYPLDTEARWLCPPIDRYRRPYEGTDVDRDAMEAYLEWEYGLVDQLERDGTHRFAVYVE